MDDLINRQAAIDALWKALYKYEDETEQKFQTSDELNIDDWFMHRIFVQNMSDIDRQTILDLPPVDAVEVVRCKDCIHCQYDRVFKQRWCYGKPVKEDDYCSYGEREDPLHGAMNPPETETE